MNSTAPDYRLRNSCGEYIRVGQVVDRLDRYFGRCGGTVMAINLERHGQKILVRWPHYRTGRRDEWCTPELLRPVEGV